MDNATATSTPEPTEPTETETTLQGMFTENTGIAMMDSGGENGRAWQRNQGVSLADLPDVTVDGWGFHPTVSTFHWLNDLLSFDSEKQAELDKFETENDDLHYLALGEAFVEERHPEATGLYGEGAPFTVNTYNHECALGQTLQFYYFEINEDAFIALSVHGGADVRGGYTAPKIFKVEDEGCSMLDFSRCGAYCPHCEERWYSDNAGHNFYSDDGCEDFEGSDVKQTEEEDRHERKYLCPNCNKPGLEGTR
jgi:hypothetical protein